MRARHKAGTIALLSSLRTVLKPQQPHAAKEVAFTHLTAQFNATQTRELASSAGSKVRPSSATVDDLIAALGVAVDPAALPSNKAAAFDTLKGHFKSLPQTVQLKRRDPMLEEALGTEPATRDDLLAALAVVSRPDASEKDRSKALALLSAYLERMHEADDLEESGRGELAAARRRVAALVTRCSRIGAAEAARSGRIQRGARLQYGDGQDPIGRMIDTAWGNSRRNDGEPLASIGKGPPPRRPLASAPTDPGIAMIERAHRNASGGRR